jgi:hypothetical protein
MSSITFTLHKKKLSIAAENSTFSEKLFFQARLPKHDTLSTVDGKQVKIGYVQFVFDDPNYEADQIYFNDALEDIDTGSTSPPSISFYARVPSNIFALMRDSHPNSLLELTIQTAFMGAIRFNDPMGCAKIWDTLQQNPMPVESYEIIFEQPEDDA